MINGLRESIVHLEQRMDQRFAAVDQRFAAIDQRFERLEDKMSTQFYWIVGIQMTTFVATIATILTAVLTN